MCSGLPGLGKALEECLLKCVSIITSRNSQKSSEMQFSNVHHKEPEEDAEKSRIEDYNSESESQFTSLGQSTIIIIKDQYHSHLHRD